VRVKIPTVTFKEQLAYAKAVWRLILLISAAQVTYGIFLISKQWCVTAFGSFWYGGAIATPAGFLPGVLWQHFAQPGSIRKNWPIVLLLALGAVIMPIAALSEMYSFVCTTDFISQPRVQADNG
jgi:hypothetical protein